MADHQISNENAIFSLWLNWTMSLGALTAPMMFGLFIPKIWLPLITFAIMGLLIVYHNSGQRYRASSCSLIPTIAIKSLALSGFTMMVICILYVRGIIQHFYNQELLNEHIPFIAVLVIAPVTLVVSVWTYFRRDHSAICHECHIRYGGTAERGFIGKIFRQESQYQLISLILLAAVLSVLSWGYYALFYVNVNINSPDKFFFNWVPIVLYLLSIVYIGARYFSLWGYYYQDIEGSNHRHGSSTCIRYIILCDEHIFLSKADEFHDIPDLDKYDSPGMLIVNHRDSVSIERATSIFKDISNIDSEDFSIRFMYSGDDASGSCNFFHFICCVDNKEVVENSQLKGTWYSLSQLQRLLHNHDLSPLLASEIHRLYTVTMAWKTYDIEGRRLYKVKNYRPMFRLSGICEWDVDFNNPRWLQVSTFNQDKPLYKIRRLWHKYY